MGSLVRVSVLGVALALSGVLHAACGPTPEKPNGLYLDHGNGTVTDNQTGLMWRQCPVGLSGAACATGAATSGDWQAALAAVQTANSAVLSGYSDWRLPNAKELASLSDKACSGPAINTTRFPATGILVYWTSTPSAQAADSALIVDFNTGALGSQTKVSAGYIQLVRAGN